MILEDWTDEARWVRLRCAIEDTGLIIVEPIPSAEKNIPFIRFHPILAPTVWKHLTDDEQKSILSRYRQCYYHLGSFLISEDNSNPFKVRNIAKRELPNLQFALYSAIHSGEDFAVEFTVIVTTFLNMLGKNKDSNDITQHLLSIQREVDSHDWALTQVHLGCKLMNESNFTEASIVFENILSELKFEGSYISCYISERLGKLYESTGQLKKH